MKNKKVSAPQNEKTKHKISIPNFFVKKSIFLEDFEIQNLFIFERFVYIQIK